MLYVNWMVLPPEVHEYFNWKPAAYNIATQNEDREHYTGCNDMRL